MELGISKVLLICLIWSCISILLVDISVCFVVSWFDFPRARSIWGLSGHTCGFLDIDHLVACSEQWFGLFLSGL